MISIDAPRVTDATDIPYIKVCIKRVIDFGAPRINEEIAIGKVYGKASVTGVSVTYGNRCG